jgi:hypothetical protein
MLKQEMLGIRRSLVAALRLTNSIGSYKWCLGWKQMGKQCRMQKGSRDWTKEEMMAYLDWSKAEEDQAEARVAAEMEGNPFSNRGDYPTEWAATPSGSIEPCQASMMGRLSIFLGGKAASDGPKWAPNLEAVRAAVRFAMATGRLSREGN